MIPGFAACLALWLGATPVKVEPPPRTSTTGPYSLLVLSSTGLSTTIDPRVVNVAAPSVELRFSYRDRNQQWIEFDTGIALIAFPELVPELRVGARFFPIGAFSQLPVIRDLFVRVGAQTLLSVAGFDYAPNAEVGFAFSGRQLIVFLALSETYYIVNPRLATDVRLGAGFRF